MAPESSNQSKASAQQRCQLLPVDTPTDRHFLDQAEITPPQTRCRGGPWTLPRSIKSFAGFTSRRWFTLMIYSRPRAIRSTVRRLPLLGRSGHFLRPILSGRIMWRDSFAHIHQSNCCLRPTPLEPTSFASERVSEIAREDEASMRRPSLQTRMMRLNSWRSHHSRLLTSITDLPASTIQFPKVIDEFHWHLQCQIWST